MLKEKSRKGYKSSESIKKLNYKKKKTGKRKTEKKKKKWWFKD